MFKIINQRDDQGLPTKYYTLHCYYLDEATNSNKEVYYVSNLTKDTLTEYLSTRTSADIDFSFVVLKSTPGLCILTSKGEIMPLPVKKVTYN